MKPSVLARLPVLEVTLLPGCRSGALPIAFGLWKGDLTLKRALERELQVLVRSGRLYDIVASYSDPSLPILDHCVPCEGAAP